MKRHTTQAHRQGGNKTVKSQVPPKPKAAVRKVASAAAVAARNKPALPLIKPGGMDDGWVMTRSSFFSPSELEAQLNKVASALALNPDDRRVLGLICQWELLSPMEFCWEALSAMLLSSFEDMSSFTKTNERVRDRRWAKVFHPRVKAYFEDLERQGGAR